MGTALTGAGLVALVVVIIKNMIKSKKLGVPVGGCGCDCNKCGRKCH